MSDEKKIVVPSLRNLPSIPSQIKPNVFNSEQKSETTAQPEHIAATLPSIEILPATITEQTEQVVSTLPQNETVISHFENEVNMSQFEKAYLQLLSVGRFALSREEFLPIYKHLYNIILTDLPPNSHHTTNSTPPTIKDKKEDKDIEDAPMKRGGGSTGRGNRAPKISNTKYRESAAQSNENSSAKTPKKPPRENTSAILDFSEVLKLQEERRKRQEAKLNNTNSSILDEYCPKEKEEQKTLFSLRKADSINSNNIKDQTNDSNLKALTPSQIRQQQLEQNKKNNSSILSNTQKKPIQSLRQLSTSKIIISQQPSEIKITEENPKEILKDNTKTPYLTNSSTSTNASGSNSEKIELEISPVRNQQVDDAKSSDLWTAKKINGTIITHKSNITAAFNENLATSECHNLSSQIKNLHSLDNPPVIMLLHRDLLIIEFNPALTDFDKAKWENNLSNRYSGSLCESDQNVTLFSIQNQGEEGDNIECFVKNYSCNIGQLFKERFESLQQPNTIQEQNGAEQQPQEEISLLDNIGNSISNMFKW